MYFLSNIINIVCLKKDYLKSSKCQRCNTATTDVILDCDKYPSSSTRDLEYPYFREEPYRYCHKCQVCQSRNCDEVVQTCQFSSHFRITFLTLASVPSSFHSRKSFASSFKASEILLGIALLKALDSLFILDKRVISFFSCNGHPL